jgi:hypothetical protein
MVPKDPGPFVITAPGGNLFTAPTAPEYCFTAIYDGADLVKNIHAGVEQVDGGGSVDVSPPFRPVQPPVRNHASQDLVARHKKTDYELMH